MPSQKCRVSGVGSGIGLFISLKAESLLSIALAAAPAVFRRIGRRRSIGSGGNLAF